MRNKRGPNTEHRIAGCINLTANNSAVIRQINTPTIGRDVKNVGVCLRGVLAAVWMPSEATRTSPLGRENEH